MKSLLSERQVKYNAIIKKLETGIKENDFIEELFNLTYPYVCEYIEENKKQWPFIEKEDMLLEIGPIIIKKAEFVYKTKQSQKIFYYWYYATCRSLGFKLDKLNKKNQQYHNNKIVYMSKEETIGDNDPPDLYIAKENIEELKDAYKILSEKEKLYLRLKFIEGLCAAQIAKREETSHKTVQFIIDNAISKLREYLTTKEEKLKNLQILKEHSLEKQVMEYRYLQNLSANEISKLIPTSISNVYKIIESANAIIDRYNKKHQLNRTI